jgi:zinc D-Ala-D-Ala carboxypeptidase
VHFTYAEASANCGKGFTGGAAEKENMKRALWRAEALRHQLGDHPLRVTSGYRDSRPATPQSAGRATACT